MPEFVEIGEVVSLHGYKGELLIHFADRLENLKEKELFFVLIDGIHVPFFIDSIRKKSKARFAVTFIDVDSQDKASELLNAKVFTEHQNIVSEEDSENEFLIGYSLYDEDRYIGKVSDFFSMAANDLLEVYDESKQKEVLIPYNEALIESIDSQNQIIRCKLPEGLLDIND